MLHRKLLLRRWACVPWLLAVGLVLGWSGGAVADTGADHYYGDHVHATDPKMVLTFEKGATATPYANEIKVSWSKSRMKGFSGADATKNGNEITAPTYSLTLFSGEIPAYSAIPAYSTNVIVSEETDADPALTHTFTGSTDGTETSIGTGSILYNGQLYDTGNTPIPADGKYWVRLGVDPTGGEPISYFAKQIVLEPDFELTVHPASIREDDDARPTEITIRVKVSNGQKVAADTPVLLNLASYTRNFSNRFSITLPSLEIPDGETEAVVKTTLTPIDNEDGYEGDLPILIEGSVVGKGVASAEIILIDDDKESNYINLSFSPPDLSKRDPATNVVVTATLDGKELEESLSFGLTIDRTYETTGEAPNLVPNPKAAVRDDHYEATRMGTIIIRRGSISGRTTINISPKNIDEITSTRSFRVVATANPRIGTATEVTTDDRTIMVNSAFFDITGDPGKAVTGLTATPFSIREDALSKEVTLEVVLQNALAADERVHFSFYNGVTQDLINRLGGDFEEADSAQRDTHYDVRVQPLTIRRGETRGTTTMTVTVSNDEDLNDPRAFRVVADVGGAEYDTGILITDDDRASGLISLEVSPAEISEDAGPTTVTVTGTLHGKEFDDAIVVPLIIDMDPKDPGSDGRLTEDVVEATRDVDYETTPRPLTIAAGSVTGATTFTITPKPDTDAKEGDEKIRLKSLAGLEALDEDDIPVKLTVSHVDITLKDSEATGATGDTDPSQTTPQDPTRPSFAADAEIADQVYTVGTAIDPLVLPEAVGDDTPFMYNVFSLGLPTGLTFDPATRTLSGTPTAATDGPVSVFYTVVDSDNDAGVPLTFSITVNAAELAPSTADAEIMATPSLIREDAGETQVSLTVSLTAAKDADERVTFMIVGPSEGTEGKPAGRDVDYDATLGAVVTIPAGATVGTSTLTITPRNNTRVDGLRAIGVQATFSSGATLLTDIEISDDETSSTSIALSVNPHSVSEDAGTTDVSVTATLDGQALAEDATVSLSIDNASTAQRDVDYSVEFTPLIEIPAGSIIGVTLLTLRPIDDDIAEGDEIIRLVGMIGGLVGDEAELLLSDTDQAMAPEAPETPETPEDGFAFVADVDDQSYTVGTAITPLVLPAASGGTGALTYILVGTLPAGLSFDVATRTLSGTPTAATDGAVEVSYIVTDEGGSVDLLTFNITVNTDTGMSTSFGFAGAVVPDQKYTADAAITPLVLPAASGGTGALTYRLVGLPAGLSFDAATRTLSGTPTAATNGAVEVSYIVTDEGGSIAFLTFNITVNPALSFGGFGFGKIVPTASHDLAKIREFVVGQRVEDFALPEASGGTAPLTYTLSPALPVGLTFDAATRTIAGTPRAEGETAYTYTVTDANGASASLSLQTLPAAFSLADNFPNPFNPATTIQYALPQAADVELTVYNVVGQVVRTLVAEHQSAGRYVVEWDATNDSGHSLSSGMYFYRLQAGGEFHEVKKMLLLK